MHSHGRVLWFILAPLALAACGRKDAAPLLPAADASHAQPAAEAYLQPPQVLAVTIQTEAGGVIAIQGRGFAGLAHQRRDARQQGLRRDHRQEWTLLARGPAQSAQPLVIAISEADGRRALQTDGWLFVPPDAPERAVILRAGAPARPLQSGLVAAVDVDAGGGAGVSGVTAPKRRGGRVDRRRGRGPRLQADARRRLGRGLGVDKPVTAGIT